MWQKRDHREREESERERDGLYRAFSRLGLPATITEQTTARSSCATVPQRSVLPTLSCVGCAWQSQQHLISSTSAADDPGSISGLSGGAACLLRGVSIPDRAELLPSPWVSQLSS